MKQKLLNKLWLRVGMIVAIMTTALSGTVWAETVTFTFTQNTDAYGSGVTPANSTDLTVGTSFTVSPVSITYSAKGSGSTNLRWWNTTDGLRAYKENEWTIAVSKGYLIDKVVYTGTISPKETSNTGGTIEGSTWTAPTAGGVTSVSFSGTHTSSNKSIKTVTVTYSTSGGGSTLTASDLALTGAPVELSFDLYNNSDAQTISFTSSSTGAVTVSESDYVETSVSGNTITVTPVKVTPSKQTITVSQAADDTYEAGEKTFTVNITDSTPFNGVIFDATQDTGESPIIKDNVSFACSSGVLNNGSEYRMYKSSTTTISTTDGSLITKIEFTGVSSNPASGFGSQTGWSTDGNNGVWEGEAESVSFVASGAQVRATLIKVTVEANTNPSITASNVNIEYNATSGSISYTLTNEVTGGVLSAEITGGNEGNWLSLGTVGATVPFTCTANSTATERTAQVTLTYTYNTSETKTAVVTVTQAADPNAVMTITEVRTQGTGSVQTKGIVTNVSGKTAYIQDSNAAIVVYDSQANLSCVVGNEIRVSGTLTTFNGLLEIGNPTVVVLSSGNTVTPEVMTIAQVKESTKQGWFVKIEDATVTEIGSNNNNTIAQGENTITLHGNLGTVEENDIITFNGNIGCFNTVQIVNPTDITVTGSVTPTTYTITWEESANNTEIFVYDAADENNSLTSPASVAANTTINVSVSAASGFTLDALTIKDAGNNDITYSEIGEGYYQFTMPASNVTITATAVAATPPTPVSGKYVKVTSTSDITDGQYLIVYEDGAVAFDGSLATLDVASNTIDVTITDDEITATDETVAAEFTIDVTAGTILSASGFYIGQTSNANGLASSEETDYTNTITFADGSADIVSSGGAYLRYNSASNQTRFRYYKSSSYTSQKAIQLYKKVESVTVSSAGYATYCSENALDFTGTDIKAYVGTKNSDKLTFTPINQVPANTGMLLVYAGGKTENVPVIASATAVEGNCLVGVNVETNISSNDYILNKVNDGVGFYRAGSYTELGAHKAYIPAAVGGNVKGFTIDFDDDATGISLMEDGRSQMEDGVIYNLAGQRISKMQKGINIVNGKKVLK